MGAVTLETRTRERLCTVVPSATKPSAGLGRADDNGALSILGLEAGQDLRGGTAAHLLRPRKTINDRADRQEQHGEQDGEKAPHIT